MIIADRMDGCKECTLLAVRPGSSIEVASSLLIAYRQAGYEQRQWQSTTSHWKPGDVLDAVDLVDQNVPPEALEGALSFVHVFTVHDGCHYDCADVSGEDLVLRVRVAGACERRCATWTIPLSTLHRYSLGSLEGAERRHIKEQMMCHAARTLGLVAADDLLNASLRIAWVDHVTDHAARVAQLPVGLGRLVGDYSWTPIWEVRSS